MGQCNSTSATAVQIPNGVKPPEDTDPSHAPPVAMADPIISADDLKKLLDSAPDKLRILDVTIGDEDGYKGAHIPGAVYMDIFHKVEHTEFLVRNLPTPDVFEAYVRSLGVSDDSDVILYDRAESGCGYMSSGRAWFLFKYHGHNKVRVLDGGMGKWKEANYPTSSEVPSPEPGFFTVNVQKQLVKTFEDVVANLETNAAQVFDTRPPGPYGEGHIAGAKNLPFNGKLLDPANKCLRTVHELKTAFEEANIDLSKPVIASCTGGMTSCTALIAATLLGNKDVPLYIGSWMEWSKRATESQIEK